jgi:hypothetical protein
MTCPKKPEAVKKETPMQEAVAAVRIGQHNPNSAANELHAKRCMIASTENFHTTKHMNQSRI